MAMILPNPCTNNLSLIHIQMCIRDSNRPAAIMPETERINWENDELTIIDQVNTSKHSVEQQY